MRKSFDVGNKEENLGTMELYPLQQTIGKSSTSIHFKKRLEIFLSLFYTECGIPHFLFCHCLRGLKLSRSRQEGLNHPLEML